MYPTLCSFKLDYYIVSILSDRSSLKFPRLSTQIGTSIDVYLIDAPKHAEIIQTLHAYSKRIMQGIKRNNIIDNSFFNEIIHLFSFKHSCWLYVDALAMDEHHARTNSTILAPCVPQK